MNLALGMGLNKMRHGALLNQTVPPVIPDTSPTEVTAVTDTSFTVTSSVDPDGAPATVTLEIGTSTGNYNLTPVTANESPVSNAGEVTFNVSGLTPYTDYYFRVKAVNTAGTSYTAEFLQKTAWQNTAPSGLTLTVISDTQINLSWTDNSVGEDSFCVERSTDGVNYTEIATPTGSSYNDTGLSNYTRYYYRVRAKQGSNYSAYSSTVDAYTFYYFTLTSSGNGTGVSTFVLSVSENISVEIIAGTARFYTDSGGTTGESTTWSVTTGALRTIYLKAPSGVSTVKVINAGAITGIGNSGNVGWVSGSNAAVLGMDVSKPNITQARITGSCNLTGGFKNALTYFLCNGDFVDWTYSGAMPTSLTSLYLNSGSMNLTSLDFTGSGNITSLSMLNYRQAKMSSADMVTLLTSLANRAGSLPATITINDYADYASPPTSVTNAVAALKAAKPSVTTVNLGA